MLLPFAWLVLNFDADNTALLLGFAYFSLLSTGVLEWVQPCVRHWHRSQGDLVTDVLHQLLTSFFAQIARVFLVVAFFLALNASAADFALSSWPGQWPLWAQTILALVVVEFADYWRHRFFHSLPLAWRFHAIHHSPGRVYFLNANRFHILDACINSLVGASALALVGATPEVVLLVGVFTGLHGPWQHANVYYRLGWLNWVFAGAELHRWHHSTRPEQSNTNYGNNLIIWDAIFGTRLLPTTEMLPQESGLGSSVTHFPQSWLGQQLIPFRWGRTVEPD